MSSVRGKHLVSIGAVIVIVTMALTFRSQRAAGDQCANSKCLSPGFCEYGVAQVCTLEPLRCSVEWCQP
jgi:hypothetical protein